MKAKSTTGYLLSGLLLLVVLGCIFIVMALHHRYYNDQLRDALRENQQQRGQSILFGVEQAIEAQRTMLTTLAASDFIRPEAVDPTASQQPLDLQLPSVNTMCLLPNRIDTTGNDDCLPVSFVTLTSLRQLQQQPVSDLAVVQLGTENAYIFMAARATKLTAFPDASVLMSLEQSWLDALISPRVLEHGYAEITQGDGRTTLLGRYGDATLKQGGAVFSQPIANSHWHLQLWMPLTSQTVSWWYGMLALVAIVAMLWCWREMIYRRRLHADSAVIQMQLADLSHDKMKTFYAVKEPALVAVRDAIHRLILKRAVPVTAKADDTIAAADSAATQQVQQHNAQLSARQLGDMPATPEVEFIEEENEVEADSVLEFETATLDDVLPSDDDLADNETVAFLNEEDSAPDPLPAEALPKPAIFRKYDIRGVVGEQLTSEVMYQLGQAIGSEVLDRGLDRLVVGRDGRLSSQEFSDALKDGVLSTGCGVVDVGLVPTPVLYFIAEHSKTLSGAMITGSHNPAGYNGVKVVVDGKPLLGNGVMTLYERLRDNRIRRGFGLEYMEEAIEPYIQRVCADIKLKRSLRVVVDCGNGVAGAVAPDLFNALGCEVIPLYCEVDGQFPNHHPNPGQPENLQDLIRVVRENQADLGIAFDGDGDRLGVVDGKGRIIWPDRLLLLMAQQVLAEHPGAIVTYDVKSSDLLANAIKAAGGEPLMTPTGHSVIRNTMQEKGAILGGELSGHIFFRDRWYGFDDALYSAARLLELLTSDPQHRTAAELFDSIPSRMDTPEIFINMSEGESQRFIQQLQQQAEFEDANVNTLDGLRVEFAQGWGLVRASNTMPGLTLRFEAISEQELVNIKQAFKVQMRRVKPTLIMNF